jgi:hypothetical protein
MSEEPTLSELKSLLTDEYKGFISELQEKKTADKEAVIAKVTALSTQLGQEIKKEDLEKMETASLGMLETQLKNLLEARNADQGGDPLSGTVPRGGEPTQLTKLEINNILINMIMHSFGLPVEDTDEYREICEQVRMEHYGEGLRY